MSRLAARAAAAVVAIALGVPLGACSAGQTTIGSASVAGCAQALPTAVDAVHQARARLLGVHRVPADRLPARIRQGLPPGDDRTVCAVAFRGTFAAGQVTGARPGASGIIAVVLVDARHLQVLGAYVGDRLPHGLAGHLV